MFLLECLWCTYTGLGTPILWINKYTRKSFKVYKEILCREIVYMTAGDTIEILFTPFIFNVSHTFRVVYFICIHITEYQCIRHIKVKYIQTICVILWSAWTMSSFWFGYCTLGDFSTIYYICNSIIKHKQRYLYTRLVYYI